MCTTTVPSSWYRPGCSTCLRWWTFTRSRRERKANAQNESDSFRGVDPVRAIRFCRDGDCHQEDRCGEVQVWTLSVWLLHRVAGRTGLADAFRSRLNRMPFASDTELFATIRKNLYTAVVGDVLDGM